MNSTVLYTVVYTCYVSIENCYLAHMGGGVN